MLLKLVQNGRHQEQNGGSSYSSVSSSSQNKNKTAYLSATGKNIIQYQTAEEWILARPQLLQLKKQKQEVMDVAASAGNIFS